MDSAEASIEVVVEERQKVVRKTSQKSQSDPEKECRRYKDQELCMESVDKEGKMICLICTHMRKMRPAESVGSQDSLVKNPLMFILTLRFEGEGDSR